MTFGDAAFAAAKANNLQRLDKFYQIKGWDIYAPSQGDTVLQDIGGLRTTLDKYGIGVIQYNQLLYAQNVLDTPLKTPQSYAPNPVRNAVGAGNQVYNGERPTFAGGSFIYVTYDTSRLGIPDGQIAIDGAKLYSTWQPLVPNLLSLGQFTYYQTAFDKKLEIEFGLLSNTSNFVGTDIGGTFATTFGPAASIHVLLGMSFISSPAIDLKYNFDDHFYTKASVQRSDPVNGPTGNPIFDGSKENPTGLTFSTPADGVLLIDEIGYRKEAAPGDPQTWLRAGGLYNNSRFRDFSKLTTDPSATLKGNAGVYALGDRQVLQTAPESPFSAYRGLYVGATFEYAPPRETPVTQYYEARIYSIGPFASRPTDLVSFVYNHQIFSHYIPDQLNPLSLETAALGVSTPMAHSGSNSYTVSYLAHLSPGVYLTTGLGYTDNPSTTSFRGEGHALNFLSGMLTVF